jgi:ankyrin repeat protein
VCEYILSKIHMHSHFGYNELHWLALKNYKKGEKMKEFKSVSVAKKGTNCWSITPLHFACINPNTEVLKQLLAVNGDTNMMDVHMRKPIHFAAVCESVENLKYLIEEKNVSIIDISMQKETPLHYAAGTGRVNNVKYLISKNQDMFLMKDKTA